MLETASRIERYFTISKQEMLQIILTALVAAFCLTISNGWGFFNITQGQGLSSYLINLLIVFFFAFLAIIFQVAVQKFIAIRLGYLGKFTYWKNGFILSILISFISFGFLPLFFTGSMRFEVEKKLRLGRFRYGLMNKDVGWISFAAPFFTLLLAAFIGLIYVGAGSNFLFALIVTLLLSAVYSLIPLPVFEGVKDFKGGTPGLFLFIASRWAYVVTSVFVLIYSLLVLVGQLFSIAIAAIIGIIAGILYYINYEKL